ncbi:MAG TPA: hypothetical protein VFF04_04695 [Candidatus Babeliales bacterium]|nr:hypothetical protein [Candidatus Babeliales bacterium]
MKTVLKISLMICLVVMISKVVLTAAERKKHDEAQKQITQSVTPKVHAHAVVHGAPATVSPVVNPYQHQPAVPQAPAETPPSTARETASAQKQQPAQESYEAERAQHREDWQRRESEEQAAYVTAVEQQEEQLEVPSESSTPTFEESQDTAPISDGGAQENESSVSNGI